MKRSSKAAKLLSVRRWDFVGDAKFQEILTRDYRELRQIAKTGARKGTVVMCGSLLEAILVAKLSTPEAQVKYAQKHGSDLDVGKVQDWGLERLIESCADLGYLDDIAKHQAHIVRNYRNLIHPGLEKRRETKVEVDLVVAVVALFNHVVRLLAGPRVGKPKLTARERFLKRLRRKCGETEVATAVRMIEWAEKNGFQQRWTSSLTYAPRLHHDGNAYSLFIIRTSGKFQIQFKSLMTKPSMFQHEKHRESLRQRLNQEALDQRIGATRINDNPAYPLRLIADETVCSNFLSAMDWVVTGIKQ